MRQTHYGLRVSVSFLNVPEVLTLSIAISGAFEPYRIHQFSNRTARGQLLNASDQIWSGEDWVSRRPEFHTLGVLLIKVRVRRDPDGLAHSWRQIGILPRR